MKSKLIVAIMILFAIVLPLEARGSTAEIQLGMSCVTTDCHGDVKESRHLHGPVNLGQCSPCHEPIDGRHVFKPADLGPDLCKTCHETESPKAHVHGPFQSDCTQCHSPHGGSNRHFLKGGGGADLCNQCHDSVTHDRAHLHGPVAMGECLACHTAHQSDHAGLLVESRRDLCLGCHVDVAVSMTNAVAVHHPVEESCSGCHDPHGGKNEFFLPYEGSELCMTCHGDFIAETKQVSFPHAGMTDGKGCRNCHAPHASSQTGLLATETQQLCLSCHSESIHRDGRTVDNISKELEEATFLHGPIREQNCVACHKAHGSEVASILRKPYPKEFYAPYKEGAYDLCFECHDRTLVESSTSQATGFRDGEKNLHFLHVNREKGRTCRACHAEHASSQPNHVRSEVPFGRWMMKVDFTRTETGGTCETGCHLPYSYDRLLPVNEAK